MRAENPLGVRSGLWPLALRFQLCCFFTLPYLTLPYLCVRASFITDITHSPQNIFESYTVINAAVYATDMCGICALALTVQAVLRPRAVSTPYLTLLQLYFRL